MKNVKAATLATIASDLRARLHLAHISDASRRDVVEALLNGAVTLYATAKAMGDTTEMAYQKARGVALLLELETPAAVAPQSFGPRERLTTRAHKEAAFCIPFD